MREVIVERRGAAGFLSLNRPAALNALTLDMVREIAAGLDAFEPEVERVVIQGAGGRAFCAGGDIRWLYERGLAQDHAAQAAFFREEYRLNARIKRYSKPYIALIDGIVMGGGVGVSLHGSHRIATERAAFAMPEVGIGFFPDVGATYALPRLPHRIGWGLALTGLRAKAGDMAALGLATQFTPSAKLADLARALEQPGDTGAILDAFKAEAPPSPLLEQAALFERAFAADDLKAALEAEGSDYARHLLAALATKSPTSLAIALRQMQIGAALSFEEAMRVEFRIVSRICQGADFVEGVRAAIVDRDNRPQWAVAPESIESYFAPLGGDELKLGEAA